jgi:hypothetical protein
MDLSNSKRSAQSSTKPRLRRSDSGDCGTQGMFLVFFQHSKPKYVPRVDLADGASAVYCW